MLWVPQKGIVRMQHNVGNVGTLTPGTSVTTGGTSPVKGTAVQLIASTNFDAYWVKVTASDYGLGATNASGCLDILIGAATEEVLIPNLLMGDCGGASAAAGGPKIWEFPLYIPAGSRIAAQVAGLRVSTAMRVQIYLYGGHGYPPWRVGSKVTTYGIGTVPQGTSVTPGASGAEGSWTQISASSSADHFCFVPSMQRTPSDTTFTPIELFFMDMGIGSATEETLIGTEQSYIFRTDTNEFTDGPYNSFPCFQDVPSGTRLVARLSSSGAAQTTGVPECAIHAVS
jgi:hypothetical protein